MSILSDSDPKIALCLSGGGYRAALFHLGALRRLNELGILKRLDSISSVSGGSIISGFLAKQCAQYKAKEKIVSNWDREIAFPFKAFCQHDIRTGPILRRILVPWWRDAQVIALEKIFDKWFQRLKLSDLPLRPRFIFCATDILFGVNWIFERNKVGDYRAGYLKPSPHWTVAKAVAASSCFPPIFDPMRVGKEFAQERSKHMEISERKRQYLNKIRLCDGGIYDNIGLEPVWKNHDIVIVSDGGAPFKVFTAQAGLRLWKRYFDIAANQAMGIRKRWLIAQFHTQTIKNESVQFLKQGCYWSIGNSSNEKEINESFGYSNDFIRGFISRIRTDLDGFLTGEIAVLENHGYMVTDRIIKKRLPGLLPDKIPKLKIPNPEWMDDKRAREELRYSAKRISLGRLLKKWQIIQ